MTPKSTGPASVTLLTTHGDARMVPVALLTALEAGKSTATLAAPVTVYL